MATSTNLPIPVFFTSRRAARIPWPKEHAGHNVANGRPNPHRLAVLFAGNRHHAATGLDHHVIGRFQRIRAGVAKPRYGAIDQPGVLGVQVLPAISKPLHHTGAVVLQNDIGLRQKPFKYNAVSRCLQVQRDTLLTVIDGGEIGALAVLEGGEGAGVVALARLLHLDNPGPQVRQDHRAIGPRQHMGEVQNGDVFERGGHGKILHLFLSFSDSHWCAGCLDPDQHRGRVFLHCRNSCPRPLFPRCELCHRVTAKRGYAWG